MRRTVDRIWASRAGLRMLGRSVAVPYGGGFHTIPKRTSSSMGQRTLDRGMRRSDQEITNGLLAFLHAMPIPEKRFGFISGPRMISTITTALTKTSCLNFLLRGKH